MEEDIVVIVQDENDVQLIVNEPDLIQIVVNEGYGPTGATGETGPSGAALVYRGAYNSLTDYSADDLVSFGGSTWVSLTGSLGVEPVEGTDWTLFVAKGETGQQGIQGLTGLQGTQGPPGADGAQGEQGIQGIQGIPGEQGPAGPQGDIGPTGADSMVPGPPGPQGAEGDSAFEIAQLNGFVGTEAEWLLSLVGEQGIQGIPGDPGADGNPGADGLTTSVNGVSQVAGAITLTGSDITFTPMDGTGNLPDTVNTLQELAEAVNDIALPTQYTDEMAQDVIAAAIAAGTHTGITITYDDVNNKLSYSVAPAIQTLGVKSADFTVDRASGEYATVTTGTAAIAMTLASPASSTNNYRQVVAILQGATARVVTLKGTDANVVSSGGLMSSGDALPNSGANTLDVFTFEWNGAQWETMDARYDVKA